MNRLPEVSIIIPAYNRCDLLKRALRSVLGQTYGEWEAIVVDDGSTDETDAVRGEFPDARFRFIRHLANRGPAAARNTAIVAARGSILAFLDSDDEWAPDKLARQMNAFQTASGDAGVIYTGTRRYLRGKAHDIPSARIKGKEGNVFSTILRGAYLVHTSAGAMKRECLKNVGFFDASLPALEEWDLWIRLAKVCRFMFIPEPLTISYDAPGSLSADRQLFFRSKGLILRKHRKEFLRSPAALASILSGMACGCGLVSAAKGRGRGEIRTE
jgi:glycosyltransferase involved in cell wall biosynthesis